MASTLEPPKTSAIATVSAEALSAILGNFSRWRMLQELAGGEGRTITELAAAGECSYDSARNHLVRMRELGLVMQGRGKVYSIPARFLPTPGQRIVDYGLCLIRFDAGQ